MDTTEYFSRGLISPKDGDVFDNVSWLIALTVVAVILMMALVTMCFCLSTAAYRHERKIRRLVAQFNKLDTNMTKILTRLTVFRPARRSQLQEMEKPFTEEGLSSEDDRAATEPTAQCEEVA